VVDHGGGILIERDSKLAITNTILWGNHAYQGKEMLVYPDAPDPSVTYCDIRYGWPGTGNIDADPLFMDPDGNDFHITYDSPCRDTGKIGTAPGIPKEDYENDPRKLLKVDIGADEFYTHLYVTGDVTPGGDVALKFVGEPDAPMCLFIGAGILEPPLQTMWGEFYIKAPWVQVNLPPVPSSGIMVLTGTLPDPPPAPYDLPMQAIIGDSLTNLCVLEVR
jgi:hypothetical protein